MQKSDALVVAGAAAVPIVLDRATSMEGVALTAAVISGLYYAVTGSTTAGAVALGTGGAWAYMKLTK